MAKYTIEKCECGRRYKHFKYLDWFDGFFDRYSFNGCGKCLKSMLARHKK